MEFDPVINAITGRTKRLKKYIKFENKINNLNFLEENYTDYMRDNLKIDEQVIGIFLVHLIEDEKISELISRTTQYTLAITSHLSPLTSTNFQLPTISASFHVIWSLRAATNYF